MRFFLILLFIALAACQQQPPPPTTVTPATLQDSLEALIAQHPEATVAVAIRDLQTGTTLDILGDRPFHAASTMKVPVMIEIYRQAEAGRFALDDPLLVKNAFRSIVDSSAFSIEDDSDDAIYERLGQKMSIRDLVYQMITVSSNLATNLLIDFISADSVQATSERLGTTTMRVLRGVEDIKAYRQGLSNSATANDLATLLNALREGEAVSPEADSAMVAVLLDQQFNEMIPSGLPADVRTAHKTGWITEIHHDAAIVYPAQGEPYVLVILTEGIPEQSDSATLGAEIARLVHQALRSTAS
ncbi:MAG TPA: serine hydrolase [Rhodothermales bacterium]|nr:serine hydrolase [Rhodothermales bacterium]